jgi:hypothetical protein
VRAGDDLQTTQVKYFMVCRTVTVTMLAPIAVVPGDSAQQLGLCSRKVGSSVTVLKATGNINRKYECMVLVAIVAAFTVVISRIALVFFHSVGRLLRLTGCIWSKLV